MRCSPSKIVERLWLSSFYLLAVDFIFTYFIHFLFLLSFSTAVVCYCHSAHVEYPQNPHQPFNAVPMADTIWSLRGSKFLANVNSRSLSIYAIACPSVCRLSVVYNVRVPYSGGSNFPQYFYGIRYLGHPLTSTENFTEIVPGTPPPGKLNTRGVATYSDFGPIDGYISETAQDSR